MGLFQRSGCFASLVRKMKFGVSLKKMRNDARWESRANETFFRSRHNFDFAQNAGTELRNSLI
jgi:hypothetical protein